MQIESITGYTLYGGYTSFPSYADVEFESLHQIGLFLTSRMVHEFPWVKSVFVCVDNGRVMSVTHRGYCIAYNHGYNEYEQAVIEKNEVKFKKS